MMLFAPVGAASAASLGCLWQCARALTAATAITSRHLSNQLVQRCTCTQAAAASSQPCATRGLPPSAAATARAPGVLAAASARLLAQWGLLPGSLALGLQPAAVPPRQRRYSCSAEPAAYQDLGERVLTARELEPPPLWQPRQDPHRLLSRDAHTPPPGEALEALGHRFCVMDTDRFSRAALKLAAARQHALLAHAEGVSIHLRSLGIGIEGVARLLQHCPALFSWPPQQRAEPLFAELMGERLGLGAAEAAEVLVCCPALANTKHVMPSIVRLVAHTRADSLSEA